MIEGIACAFAVVSLLGNIGVNLKRRWGMGCWIVSNIFFVGYNLHGQSYPQVGLFACYFLLAVWGFVRWSNGAKNGQA